MELIKLAERYIASYTGVKHALLTSMGRTALVIALKTLGVGQGKSVIVPSFTCEVVVNAVKYCGAKPIFADVDPDTFNVRPEQIEAKISKNTQAVIFIHCYGQPADVNEILEVARKNDLFVIEDAAHSFGAEYHGSKVGIFGDVSIFSFTKNMNCSSGGALVTNSDDLILKARNFLKNFDTHGNLFGRLKHITERRLVGFTKKERRFFASSRLMSISRIDIVRKLMGKVSNKIPKVFKANDQIATEVIEGLKTIDKNNKERIRKARILTEIIGKFKIDGVQPPVEKEDRKHVYYLYALRVAKRKKLTKKLEKIERTVQWGLPWQCTYGRVARELSQQLVLLETNQDFSEKSYSMLISILSSL